MTTPTGTAWSDVFNETPYEEGRYLVTSAWRKRVKEVVREYGCRLLWQYNGSFGGGYDAWMATLLDGKFVQRSGVETSEGPGTGNGMWLWGRNAVHLICDQLGVSQRPGWDAADPTIQHLYAEAIAAHNDNAGAWRWE